MSSTPRAALTRTAAAIAAGVALLAALVAAGPPAAAHEGDGELALQLADPAAHTAPGTVRYRVLLTFLNDGHPADDATVTVVAEPSGAGAVPIGPLTMAPGAAEGTYEAAVAFPSAGSWTVRFTAVTPAALLELPQELAPTPPAPTTSAAPTASTARTSSASPPTSSTATTSAVPVATGAGANPGDDPSDDGGGSGPWLVAAAVILLATGVAIGAVALVRRGRGPS
jgi:hypothetical protein